MKQYINVFASIMLTAALIFCSSGCTSQPSDKEETTDITSEIIDTSESKTEESVPTDANPESTAPPETTLEAVTTPPAETNPPTPQRKAQMQDRLIKIKLYLSVIPLPTTCATEKFLPAVRTLRKYGRLLPGR